MVKWRCSASGRTPEPPVQRSMQRERPTTRQASQSMRKTWNKHYRKTRKTFVAALLATTTTLGLWTATGVFTGAVSLWAATSLLVSCSGDEPDGPTPVNPVTPKENDTVAPTIKINKSEVEITWWKEIKVSGNQLYIWDILVASWSDDKTKNCHVELSINWKSISSGTTISEEWALTIKVSDEAGNSKSADVKLIVTKNAPSIIVNQYEINIFWGVNVGIKDYQLLFWEDVIASWNDDNLESCKVSLSFNWKDINSWDTLNEAWTLTITITNKNDKTSTAEITLTNDAIYGIDNLKNASIQVDKENNLLEWIAFADGVELVKVEVEIDGKRIMIPDPNHYTPDYPWTCNIIFTVKGKYGENSEIKVDNLTIIPLEYKAIEIDHIKPVEILPIVGQIEAGDNKCYNHIEHLRVAEATRIIDMMWKYGAGSHSAEEYQQLMMRLNTGMLWENP